MYSKRKLLCNKHRIAKYRAGQWLSNFISIRYYLNMSINSTYMASKGVSLSNTSRGLIEGIPRVSRSIVSTKY